MLNYLFLTRNFKLITNSCLYRNNVLKKNLQVSTIFQSDKRLFSVKSSLESVASTQSGIFRTLSESTPVEYVQKFLLYVHDTTGLPWWASIVCSTIFLRSTITLPLAVHQAYILAKLENIKLEMPKIVEELKKETALAIRLYKWDERTAKITYNRSVYKLQ